MLWQRRFVVLACLLALLLVGFGAGMRGAAAGDEGAASPAGPPLTILVVGYGWYRGIPEGQTNIAEIVARELDGQMIAARGGDGGMVALGKVHSLVVPVEWERAFPPVRQAIEELQPDIVVALGCSPGATGLRPEPYGVNWMYGADSADPPVSKNEFIDPQGPPYRQGNLPFAEMVVACLRAGIPAYLGSLYQVADPVFPWRCTAGRYLCNFMAYNLAAYVEEHGPGIQAGFIHIPTLPEYVAMDAVLKLPDLDLTKAPPASMQQDLIVEGVRVCLETAIRLR